MASLNKDKYAVDCRFSNALLGMRFFSLKNSKTSSVIPSTKNFVGTFQIEKIECDDGASCTVFPVASLDMLRQLFDDYKDRCIFSISTLMSVGGQTLALVLESEDASAIFDVRLGLDIYPVKVERNLGERISKGSASESVIGLSKSSIGIAAIDSSNCYKFPPTETLKMLNFFLCSEDIEFLLNADNADFYRAIQESKTHGLLVPSQTTVHRRKSALLGQDFLRRNCIGSLHCGRVKFYFDTAVHKLENCSWSMMNRISVSIINMGYLKHGAVDFELLDSIEPNDIIGKEEDMGLDLYNDSLEL